MDFSPPISSPNDIEVGGKWAVSGRIPQFELGCLSALHRTFRELRMDRCKVKNWRNWNLQMKTNRTKETRKREEKNHSSIIIETNFELRNFMHDFTSIKISIQKKEISFSHLPYNPKNFEWFLSKILEWTKLSQKYIKNQFCEKIV